MQRTDLTGRVFGRLTAIKCVGRVLNGRAKWLCMCSCGKEHTVGAGSLVEGYSKSCGCLMLEKITKHGMSRSRFYWIWHAMKKRCRNPKDRYYQSYGGRGITVCESWLKFSNFRDDMLSTYKYGLTIERINNNGNYEPANCRWVTPFEQNFNRRNTIFIIFRGQRLTSNEIERHTSLKPQTVLGRIRNGWSAEEAMTTPITRKQASC